MIRIGFVIDAGGADWLGGLNYIRNLLQAVTSLPERRIEPVLILSPTADTSQLKGFPSLEILKTPLVARSSTPWTVRKGIATLSRRDVLLDRFLAAHDVRVLSHSGHLGRHAKTAVVTWIPDFQHRALPQFFGWKERLDRDVTYRSLLRRSTTVLVSSHSAEQDLRAFVPNPNASVRVLRFATRPPEQGLQTTAAELEQRHGFTGPYFHLPNQFWAHKNHQIVVDALRLLRSAGIRPLVLATGSPSDYRNPGFFEAFRQRLSAAGVEESFRILGVVPYADLIALMRHSLAVINPSLFEGWSTSVEEAKSLGQRVLLSNLPVHIEQAPPRGAFFDPHSPGELARLLESLWADRLKPAEPATLDAGAAERYRQFGETFERVVLEAAGARTT